MDDLSNSADLEGSCKGRMKSSLQSVITTLIYVNFKADEGQRKDPWSVLHIRRGE